MKKLLLIMFLSAFCLKTFSKSDENKSFRPSINLITGKEFGPNAPTCFASTQLSDFPDLLGIFVPKDSSIYSDIKPFLTGVDELLKKAKINKMCSSLFIEFIKKNPAEAADAMLYLLDNISKHFLTLSQDNKTEIQERIASDLNQKTQKEIEEKARALKSFFEERFLPYFSMNPYCP